MMRLRKKIVFISLLVAVTILCSIKLYDTYAIGELENENESFTFTLTGDTTVIVPALSSKTVLYQVKNTTDGIIKYGVGYNTDTSLDVLVYKNSPDSAEGILAIGDNKFVKIRLENNTNSPTNVTLSTILGYENGGDLIIPSGTSLVTRIYPFPEVASVYISSLFDSDTTVTNNSIQYKYDTNHNLMKDRFGSNTNDIDTGNIRYWGENPNNYVWFGETYKTACAEEVCGTARAAGDKKLYRIIGVFDNKIKLIQNDSIGTYSWDTSANAVNSGRGINQWGPSPQDGSGYKGADLMKLLNPGYEDNEDLNNSGATITVNNSLYWNSGNGNCYKGANNATKACDFSSTGLSSSVRSKIEEVTWYLGGGSNISIYSDQAYIMEMGQNIVTNPTDGVNRTAIHNGKVGLMYPSDYGYATDLRTCQSKLGAYSSALNSYACRVNDWLYNEKGQYVITPYVTYNYIVWRVTHTGYLGGGNGAYDADTVQPVFYLKSNVIFKSGSGTETDPYLIQ